ncbi:MAG: glycosyltransferase [Candidatus Omnitrophica bacterium]|nr:glycosyltransferase [Candidatus Omnitrophota bacterium]
MITLQKLPYISVIVPAYNSEKTIRDCIDSLLNQSYPRNSYEIIAVDNNSSDNTQEIIKEYPVRYVEEKNTRSSYTSRNAGIENSFGQIIGFIDADAKADKDWISKAVETILTNKVDYLGGNIVVYSDSGKSNSFDFYSRYYEFQAEKFLKWYHYAPTCSLFVKRETFKKVGKFLSGLSSGGDYEFGNRVYRASLKQVYSQDVVVYHPSRTNLSSQVKKWLRVGGGAAELFFHDAGRYKGLISRLFNPRNYLPPNPWSFAKDIKIQNINNLRDRVSLYFLLYTAKNIRNLGGIYKLAKMSITR